MQRRYVTVDVFTEQRFGGNPLAVVLDAEGLDTAAMQAIAREFNYSETTFVLPPADPAHTAQVRIFTPVHEMPFAGHPNVGTAYVLAAEGNGAGQFVFEEMAGLVPVAVLREGGQARGAELTAPQALQRLGEVPVEGVAACLALAPDDIVGTPVAASVGVSFVLAEVASRVALRRAKPTLQAVETLLPGERKSIYFWTRDGGGADIHSRMFMYGMAEDPATGSATVTLAALLADNAPDGEHRLRVEQGRDMGRPSTLLTRVVRAGGATRSAHIGGSCVPVMRGTLEA